MPRSPRLTERPRTPAHGQSQTARTRSSHRCARTLIPGAHRAHMSPRVIHSHTPSCLFHFPSSLFSLSKISPSHSPRYSSPRPTRADFSPLFHSFDIKIPLIVDDPYVLGRLAHAVQAASGRAADAGIHAFSATAIKTSDGKRLSVTANSDECLELVESRRNTSDQILELEQWNYYSLGIVTPAKHARPQAQEISELHIGAPRTARSQTIVGSSPSKLLQHSAPPLNFYPTAARAPIFAVRH
ncbi:hypothetical protein DFH06DRAFT_1324141 [Mycena polygramma]|nr:hypothetical protein DFH06DRAFT_1324141 [Mycena polygramma]